jgi:site-specific recombinase XerD
MITTKLIFDRKKQAKKDGTGTIEVRVISDRRAYYISTGVRIREREWRAGMIINRPDAQSLNERIAIICQIIDTEVNRCIEANLAINTENLKNKVWSVKDTMSNEPSFLDWLDHQTEILNLSAGTIKHYVTLHTRLTEYGKIKRWGDLTTENISEFDAWLHKRKLSNGEAITDAAVYKYHKCLKAILNRAVMFDKIDRNPYDRLKFRRGESESIEYLTEDEMKSIENLKVPKGTQIETARDLFVFQMYTGLSYSDTQAFDFSQYKKVKGKWINVGERVKTGVAYVSSLLPPAVAVLEKYGWQVPKIDNADYNHLLKVIGTMADIPTKMHTHLARHTFATYMLRQGVKVENLQRMLGHKNIRQTMRYAKVLAESVHEDFDMVAAKLTAKPKRKKKGG